MGDMTKNANLRFSHCADLSWAIRREIMLGIHYTISKTRDGREGQKGHDYNKNKIVLFQVNFLQNFYLES